MLHRRLETTNFARSTNSPRHLSTKKPLPTRGSGFPAKTNNKKTKSVGSSQRWNDVHAASFLVEEHASIDQCKKCVITSATHPKTRMHLRAALTDDDVASNHRLAAKFFHAEALAA